MNPDAVVIGAGISGLVDAILIAETGRRVAVLEHHNIPGGCLQQFRRKGTAFDVGFHYMGSTLPGRPMRQMLEHLRVWDKVRVIPYPEEAAIEVRRGARSFAYPSRFDRFHENAITERLEVGIGHSCVLFCCFVSLVPNQIPPHLAAGKVFQFEVANAEDQEFVSPFSRPPLQRR